MLQLFAISSCSLLTIGDEETSLGAHRCLNMLGASKPDVSYRRSKSCAPREYLVSESQWMSISTAQYSVMVQDGNYANISDSTRISH